MTSLRSSGGSGDGGGGSSGSGGGRTSSHCGAVQWGVSGGGQLQMQRCQHETLSPQQLREWYARRSGGGGSSGNRCAAWDAQRGACRSSARCPYVIRTGDRAGQTCGTVGHTQSRCFSCLSDTWCAEFGDAAELRRSLELLRQGVDIIALDYDAILTTMYASTIGTKGDCSLCVLPDPGIEAVALGASESTLPSTTPAEALHTFTLDSGASHCFFRDSTTLTPLSAPVPVRLADPSGGPVFARSSTVLPGPAVPSDSLSGLHLLSFSTNLVSTAALQDAMATTTNPWGQRVSIRTYTRTGRHLATFTCQPGWSLYTLATDPPQVAASTQASASGQVAPPCSCRLLSHQTLLWHHRLGHPSLTRLRSMHSRLLVSGLPKSLPPLPPSPAPPYLPCVEGRPCQWTGPRALLSDDYTRYTTVFPLRSKGEVPDVLIPCIRAVRLQLCEQFRMEVARTSMIHAATPHFLWPFAGRYAAHQLNLWPRVSLPDIFPKLRLTGEVGDASLFQVLGSHAFVRDTSALFLASSLAFPVTRLAGSFTTPPRAVSSPLRTSRHPPIDPLPPQGPAPSGVSQVDPLPVGSGAAQGATSGGAASGSAEPGGAESGGAEPGGAEPRGAEPGGAEPGGAELGGAEPGGAEPGGAEPGGAEPGGAAPAGAEPGGAEPEGVKRGGAEFEGAESGGAEPHGAARVGVSAAGDTGAGGVGVTAGAGGTRGTTAAGPGVARTRGTVAAGTGTVGGAGAGGARAGASVEPGGARAGGTSTGGAGAGGAGAGDTGAVDPGAGGAGVEGVVSGGTGVGGTVRPRPYFVPLLQQVLGLLSSPNINPPLLCPPLDQSQPPLQPASPLPAPSPYTKQTGGLTERLEPESRPTSPLRAVCTGRRVPHPRTPAVPGMHAMAHRPSSIPLRVPVPPPPESSLPAIPDPDDPSFESTAASALVPELVDFAAAFRLDYATAFVAESESTSPPSVGGECALGTDVPSYLVLLLLQLSCLNL
ncbi:unnamed protein product [Closterium sp. NIES-53]